jgi:nucleoside-diphosphate-sugar epimerase
MRVTVIGGTGHIGTYLTPRLVEAGHEVTCVSRSRREPYFPHTAWQQVKRCVIDKVADNFGSAIVALEPEVVIDLICYTLAEAQHLVEALQGRVEQFLHCGTVWIHGHGVELPVTEEQVRRPISEYGRQKAAIEEYLLGEHRRNGFPAALIHPGHLVGTGWMPLNPAANFNPQVFAALAAGKEIVLPNFGRETLHHVHADDVAQAFVKAIASWPQAAGNSFHICSPAAVSMIGYAESVAGWYGHEARVRFLPWEEWRSCAAASDARVTWDHIARSPIYSIEKARRMLGYEPAYRSLDAIRESLSRSSHLPPQVAGDHTPSKVS